MDLEKSMQVSAAGLRAQSQRMRVISENLANSNSEAVAPGDAPYRRKIVTFKNSMDDTLGVRTVKVDRVNEDQSQFGRRFDAGHPAADENGYVQVTNVNGLIESMDMKQAQRTYEANLNAIEASRNMLMSTIDLLR
ncbi:MAG: flagellar basal body rod protein FlgC [Sphingomonadales bacterium]|nr:flagellar basal body rod protein FlgC [Sphingomonadales bacterium]